MILQSMGSEPLFVIKIASEYVAYYFSTQELSPEDHHGVYGDEPVRSYVESFGQFSATQQIEGFGSIQNMTITFNDNLGLFKTLLETYNLYDLTADVYLFTRRGEIVTNLLFFSGKLGGPISWGEGDRQLTLSIISGVIFKEFGYTPEFLGVQGVETNLITEPWPHLFGSVTLFELQPFCTTPEAHTTKALNFLYYMPERRVRLTDGTYVTIPEGYPTYVEDSDNIYFPGGAGLSDFNIVETNVMPAETGQLYNIEIPDGSVLFRGTVVNNNIQVSTIGDTIQWNVPWYENIVAWSPQQYNPMLVGQTDSTDYVANVIMLQGYGTLTLPNPGEWEFDLYQQLIVPTSIDVMFPIDYGVAIGEPGWWSDITNWQNGLTTPWLKDMYIRFVAARIKRNTENEPDVDTVELWGRVVQQDGLALYVDDVQTLTGINFFLNGWRVLFIYEATKNKIFYPYSTEIRPRVTYVQYKPTTGKLSYKDHRNAFGADEKYLGVFDLNFSIPKNATISAVGWWGTLMYPLTLDTRTANVECYIKIGTRILQLDERSQFAVLRYNKFDNGGGVKAHPFDWYRPDLTADPNTPIWQTGVSYLDSPLPYGMEQVSGENWPETFTFVILHPGTYMQMMKDLAGTDVFATLLVVAKNDLTTDEQVFAYLLEKYTSYDALQNPDPVMHHPMNFGVRAYDKETVTTFLAKLAFEHAKYIRIALNTVNMMDLLDLNAPVATTITESNIEARSINIQYTEESAIANYIKATAEDVWARGKMTIKNAISIERYTERQQDISILTNRILDTYLGADADPGDPANPAWVSGDPSYYARGYNRVLYYWLYQRSNCWQLVTFNTFLENTDLVAGDLIELDLTQQLEFLTAEETGILKYPLAGNNNRLPTGKGIIQEITINPDDWSVSIQILMNIKLGEER